MLDEILELARAYALRRWGAAPVYLKLTLPDGREQVEVVPLLPRPASPVAGPAPPVAGPAPPVAGPASPVAGPASPVAGPAPPVAAAVPGAVPVPQGPPWHSDDYTAVRWPGLPELRFGPKAAAVVKVLWEAAGSGEPDRDQAELLEAAGSDCTRLSDLFTRSPAWGVLIVRGARPGSYRLAQAPGDLDGGGPPR